MKEYDLYLDDQVNDTLGAGVDDKYLDYLTEVLLPDYPYKDKKILDVGAGKFMSWDYFLKKYEKEIEGIDIGVSSLAFCQNNFKDGLKECDAHKMDEIFEPESFDFLLSFHALEHMFDLPKVLLQCNRVLRMDGFFYLAVPIPAENWHKGHWYDIPNCEAMELMLKEAGFKRIFSKYINDNSFRPQPEMVGLFQKKPFYWERC